MLKYKALTILGRMWVIFGLVLIFLGYFQAYNDGGWSEVIQKLESFRVANLIGIAITLAPGFVLLWWAKSIVKEGSSKNEH